MKNFDVKGPQIKLINKLPQINHVDHRSILKIKEYFNEITEFIFLEVIPNDIEKEIKNLDSSKKLDL